MSQNLACRWLVLIGEWVSSSLALENATKCHGRTGVAQARLRRAQKALSRKVKGSRNRGKAKVQVVKFHVRTADIRHDWFHKLTHQLAISSSTIVVEGLKVKGMVKHRRLAQSVMDAGFFEFRRQVDDTAKEHGTSWVVADRWFPSAKTCSNCGVKTKHLPLSIREWECANCEAQQDRDLNAAIHLAALAKTAESSTACGEITSNDTAPSADPSQL